MLRFTPENWFWIIGGDESRFWSSAANAYVSTLPPAAGVTRILNEAELIEALARLGMPGPPIAPTVANLLAYAAAKRFEVETGGVTVGGAPIRTDEKSQNRVSGAAQLVANDPTLLVIDWEAQPGVWVEVSAADMKAIGIAVGRHVQACFSTLKAVQAAIHSGAITTTAEIDAAGWPG